MKDYKSEDLYDKSEWSQGVWQHEPDRATWRDDLADYKCGIDRDEETGSLTGWFGVDKDDGAYEKPLDSFPIVWPSSHSRTRKDDDGVWRFEQIFDEARPHQNWNPDRYRDWNFVTQAVTDGARALYSLSHPDTPGTRPDGPPRNPGDPDTGTGGDTPTTPPPSDGPAPQNPPGQGGGDSSPTPDNPVGTPDSGDQGETEPAPPQPVPTRPNPIPGQPPGTQPAPPPPVTPTPVPGVPPEEQPPAQPPPSEPVPSKPPDAQPPAGEGSPGTQPVGDLPGAPAEGDAGEPQRSTLRFDFD